MAKFKTIQVGGIGNYYGGLNLFESDGKCYWVIENWDTPIDEIMPHQAEEIPRDLYLQLLAFERKRQRSLKKK